MPKPISTYRLQFREGMTFQKAEELVPYLVRLGVTHLYASPVFQAIRGSTHGYDVIDPNVIDPALGGRQGFLSLASALRTQGIGLLLDIVPNHMAASLQNSWWRDIIEWGHASRHAKVFDIDWEQPLTLPFLGTSLSECLDQRQIRIAADRENGCMALAYFDDLYPLNPGTYGALFKGLAGEPAETILLLSQQAAADAEEIFHGAMRAIMTGPSAAVLEDHIARLSEDPAFLRQLHDLQSYRLTDWRDAAKGLSYRRFFEIAGLVGVRVEDPEVFERVHGTIFELVGEGIVDGLRIDHVDGLADPLAYLQQLRERMGPEPYLVVEKILCAEERLPRFWPVDGTTGYEFINALGSLLAHRPGVEALEQAYHSLSQVIPSASVGISQAKQLMMRVNFAGEMQSLARRAQSLLARQVQPAPSLESVLNALEVLLEAFPVYRTYGTLEKMPAEGASLLQSIAARCRANLPTSQAELVQRIVKLLLQPSSGDATGEFRIRFQQLSGPLMAKSMEDTLFYRHNAFIAFNEVGGEVWSAERAWPDFHQIMRRRQEFEPYSMNATATHDTKRGEDARVRLLSLSEDPERWIEGVDRWRRVVGEGLFLPVEIGPEIEWLIFQALAGAWPSGSALPSKGTIETLSHRLKAFMEKAAREAKLESNWDRVNKAYEDALKGVVDWLLGPQGADFRADFSETLAPFIRAGHRNGLTQTILKLTLPGVPDIYQGSEQMDYSLVDPDNRRPQDFTALQMDLDAGADNPSLEMTEEGLSSGRVKQQVISRILHLRKRSPDLFTRGSYQPLSVEGQNRNHLFAFLRQHESRCLIVAVPLKTLCLERGLPIDPGVGRTRVVLPEEMIGQPFTDVLTGETLRLDHPVDSVSSFAAEGYSLLFNPGS